MPTRKVKRQSLKDEMAILSPGRREESLATSGDKTIPCAYCGNDMIEGEPCICVYYWPKKSRAYLVCWEIEVNAESPRKAVRIARCLMQAPAATHLKVYKYYEKETGDNKVGE